MPLVPQLNPFFFHATMMSVEITTSVVSAAFCLLTFSSFFLLKGGVTNSHKLVIFLQINDLARAVNTFAYAVANQGDPRDCDSACKVVGFFTLWTNFNHGQIAILICYLLYMQIVKLRKTDDFSIWLVTALFNMISIFLAVIPAVANDVFYFNYSYWVDIGCLRGWAAFIYLQAPVLICEAVCLATNILVSKTINRVASTAPSCTAQNYKVDMIAKISSLPLAFAITFLPTCVYHFLVFFGYLEFSSTLHYMFAPIMMLFYGSTGTINSIIYLKNHNIGAKFLESYAQRRASRTLSRGASLTSTSNGSPVNTLKLMQRDSTSSPGSSLA